MDLTPLKIIYICGSGRSGSTLLDIILSNQEDSVGVGELNYLHRFIKSEGELCACGSVFSKCSFWPHVLKKWQEVSHQENPLEALKEKQNIFERFKTMPIGMFHSLFKTKTYKEYLFLGETLYQAIAEQSGKNILIDSSKNPLRALHLTGLKKSSFHILHLIRDGRGVAYSLSKAYEKDIKKGIQTSLKAKPVWRTAAFWVVTNLMSHITAFKGRYKRVYYEHFLKNPLSILGNLENEFDLSYAHVCDMLSKEKAFKTAHTVAGNRLRLDGAIKLKKKDDWRDHLSEKKRSIFTLCAWPLLWAYGYLNE